MPRNLYPNYRVLTMKAKYSILAGSIFCGLFFYWVSQQSEALERTFQALATFGGALAIFIIVLLLIGKLRNRA
jgi:hypothetical protein